jgi:hypothetical protein
MKRGKLEIEENIVFVTIKFSIANTGGSPLQKTQESLCVLYSPHSCSQRRILLILRSIEIMRVNIFSSSSFSLYLSMPSRLAK